MSEVETSSADEPPGRTRDGSSGAGSGAGVDVVDGERRLTPSAVRWLREQAGRALGVLGAGGEVRVRVVGDAAMAAAHERFKGQRGTTDVLTFDYAEPGAGALDADILVCVDEAARRAAELGHAVERELLLYIVHGVLHCLGYDDRDEASAAAMHRREDDVLAAIGVGPTYAAAGGMAR